MKKILLIVLSLIPTTSCNQEKKLFTGYLVAKEYTPEHMCHDNVKTQSYAIIVPYVPKPVHSHSKVEEAYVWYVANKYEVRKFNITPTKFQSKKCGDKVTIIY